MAVALPEPSTATRAKRTLATGADRSEATAFHYWVWASRRLDVTTSPWPADATHTALVLPSPSALTASEAPCAPAPSAKPSLDTRT